MHINYSVLLHHAMQRTVRPGASCSLLLVVIGHQMFFPSSLPLAIIPKEKKRLGTSKVTTPTYRLHNAEATRCGVR